MKLVYTFLFAYLCTNALAQNLSKLTVEIDVRSGAFRTNLPFDESFTIKGELAYSTRKVILKYGPVDVNQERDYFVVARKYDGPQKNKPIAEYTQSFSVKNGETNFTFSEVGPLRPNTPYTFTFQTLSQNNPAPGRIAILRQELSRKLADVLRAKQTMTIETINDAYDDLAIMVAGYMNEDQLVDATGEPFRIANYKNQLNLFSYRLLSLHNEAGGFLTGLVYVVDSAGVNNLNHNIDLILPKLTALNTGSVPLSAYSKRTTAAVVDRNYADGRTIGQPLAYLQSYLADKKRFRRIALGAGTADDSLGTADLSTLQNLIRLVEIASTPDLTKLDNSPIFTTPEVNALQEILKSLNFVVGQRNRIAENNRQVLGLRGDIVDALLRAYTDESYLLSSTAVVEATARHSSYVSLDLGVMMAYNPYQNGDGRIGNTTYFSIYEGVNIYFAPVNKRVPLRSFRWPYNFLKAFNVHVGVANFGGNYNTYRFENSFGRLGNLVLGLGLRVNSVTKVGISTMLVNMRDINPTISRSRLMPLLGANLSFDINVVDSFRNLTNRRPRQSP